MRTAAVLLLAAAGTAGCALSSQTGVAKRTSGAEAAISTSQAMTLSEADYRAYLDGKGVADLRLYLDQPDRLRDLALDLHSTVELERQAVAEGYASKPELVARLADSRRQILVTALMRQVAADVQLPDDLEVLARERYEHQKSKLFTQERRKVAHILLNDLRGCPTTPQPLDQRVVKLRAELQKGRDFAEAAKELSNDVMSASRGGELPWIVRNSGTVKAFEDAVFALRKAGDISEPILTEFGVHLIKLIEIERPRQLTFEETRDQLTGEITQGLLFGAVEKRRGLAYPDPTTINTEALRNLVIAMMIERGVEPPKEMPEDIARQLRGNRPSDAPTPAADPNLPETE